MKPLVSIIVPVYNAENYVSKCIESILDSTLKEIELILINDGSEDKSSFIIDEYAKNDARVIVIHQENKGPAATRNKGVSLAKGEYIGFVDSDDTIDKTMFYELYSAASINKVQVSMCGYNEINIKENTKSSVLARLDNHKIYNKSEIRENIITTFTKNENNGFFSMVNKIYLREWIIESGIRLDEKRFHGEDWLFNINVFLNIDSFIYVDKSLYNYIHVNNESLMCKYIEDKFDLFLDGRKKILELIPYELIDIDNFNRNFIMEFSVYIMETFKNVKESSKQKELVYRVINNKEVFKASKEVRMLPLHFKIPTFFIINNMRYISFFTYKFLGMLI